MRPRYSVPAITLTRTPHGEASASLLLLTKDFGLIRARAQGVRKPGAKLASALQTFAVSDAILVRGKDGWRISGALLVENKTRRLSAPARRRAGRVATLLLRLVPGETKDEELFDVFSSFLEALSSLTEPDADAAETLVVLRTLGILGLDAGELPEEGFGKAALEEVQSKRQQYIQRVNRGIAASGL